MPEHPLPTIPFASAFPFVLDRGSRIDCDPGLTKRELFAAMAMQGLCAGPECEGTHIEDIALAAVAMADALIDELNKPV